MPYLDKNLTKQVRKLLKKRYPEYKFSVRTRDHQAMDVTIYSGPMDLMKGVDREYDDVNHFWVDEHYEDFPEKRDFLNDVLSIMQVQQREESYDGDYGSIPTYYINLRIGSYDRPYEVKR